MITVQKIELKNKSMKCLCKYHVDVFSFSYDKKMRSNDCIEGENRNEIEHLRNCLNKKYVAME